MKYILILMACIFMLQLEIVGLLWLDHLNLNVWHAQVQLNEDIINNGTL